jgi:hypothetical protein
MATDAMTDAKISLTNLRDTAAISRPFEMMLSAQLIRCDLDPTAHAFLPAKATKSLAL